MNRQRLSTIVAVAVLATAGILQTHAQQETRPLGQALVKLDSDYVSLLGEAKKLIQRGPENYSDALDLLLGLIDKGGDNVYEDPPGSGTYRPVADGARRVLAEMPEDAMKLYRSLYEPVAKKTVDDALAKSDALALMAVESQYPLTQAGTRGRYLAGILFLDRGEFALAARCLRYALASGQREQLNEVNAHVRLAIANLKLGRENDARETVKALEQKYADTKIELAGQKVGVVTFLNDLLAQPAAMVDASQVAGESPSEWPFPAGNATASRLMNDADFVLNPQWVHQFQDTSPGNAQSQPALMAMSQRAAITSEPEIIPSALVLGDRVLVRSWDAVHCLDAYTGKLVFPRQAALLEEKVNNFGALYDAGRWHLAYNQGRLYYTENYPMQSQPFNPFQPPNPGRQAHTNNLVARDASTFKLQWRVGRGEGGDDWLKAALFYSPPIVSEGKLYLMALSFEACYLVCLDADTGALQWKSYVSAVPAKDPLAGQPIQPKPLPATSPSVYGDTVVCTTNCGVVGAFDRRTGAVKWVVQYPSVFAQGVAIPKMYPPNPLMISNDIVYAAPADTNEVVAYDLDTGQVVWRADRGNRNYVAGLANGRLIMCGPDVAGIGARTGKVEWTPALTSALFGRPALSSKYLYASVKELGIVRMDLATGESVLLPLMNKNAPLGNLLIVQDKLIVTSAQSAAAYVTYEGAYNNVTRQINGEPSKDDLTHLYRQRGIVSFTCQHFDRAIEDFQKSLELARSRQQTDSAQDNLNSICQSYIQWGLSQPLDKVQGYLEKAAPFARDAALPNSDTGARARSELAFGYAKYYEAIKNYPQAVAALQEIMDTGAEASMEMPSHVVENGRIIRNLNRPPCKNTDYARQEIARLIKEYGIAIYAMQNAQAKKAREKALAAKNPSDLLGVASRYPFSGSADDALKDAAEIQFNAQKYKETEDVLTLWRGRHRSSDTPPSLLAGLVLIYEKQNRAVMTRRYLGRLASIGADKKVEFASFKGTVKDFVDTVAKRQTPPLDITKIKGKWAEMPSDVRMPLTKLASLQRHNAGGSRQLLVGEDGSPVLFNDLLLMLEPPPTPQLTALSPRTLEPQWKALADFNPSIFTPQQIGLQVIGHVYDDMLVVSDREKIVGVNGQTGKRSWVFSTGQQWSASCVMFGMAQVAVGDQRGKVTALDPVSGKQLWEHAFRPPFPYVQMEAGSEYMAVICLSQFSCRGIASRGGHVSSSRVFPVSQQPVPGVAPSVNIITCLSAQTGKVTGEIKVDSPQEISVVMTENDQLLVSGVNFLRCYAAATGAILWEAGFKEGNPRVLTTTDEFAVVALDTAAKQEILAIDFETGKIKWRQPFEEQGRRLSALYAVAQRDQLLVTGVRRQNQQGFGLVWRGPGGWGNADTGARIVALRLTDGAMRWTSKLSPTLDDNTAIWVGAPLVTETQAIAVVRQQAGQGMRVTANVIDANSGVSLQELVIDNNAQVQFAGGRYVSIDGKIVSLGNCVVTDGVFVIEGSSSILVYDKAGGPSSNK